MEIRPAVNSVLDNGYAVRPKSQESKADGLTPFERQAIERLKAGEQQVQAKESAMRARAGEFIKSVDYEYEIGPDGKKYLKSANVKIEGDMSELSKIGQADGAVKTKVKPEEASSDGASDDKPKAVPEGKVMASPIAETSPEEQKVIRQLEQIDREVRAHEAAHRAAGGQYAGAASYGYTQGPDGRNYATSGEVPINAPAGSTPEETMRIMQQVKAAAMAPSSPSGPDMAVVASASAAITQAAAQAASSSSQNSDKIPKEAVKPLKEAYAPQMEFSRAKQEINQTEKTKEGEIFRQDGQIYLNNLNYLNYLNNQNNQNIYNIQNIFEPDYLDMVA